MWCSYIASRVSGNPRTVLNRWQFPGSRLNIDASKFNYQADQAWYYILYVCLRGEQHTTRALKYLCKEIN